ncbi:MAG TPA: cytochrome c [Gaiellaceae bacterium]|nr:cytochrome c [Gaiellaceae bacterium]
MKRRLFSAGVMLVVVLAASACGSSKSDSTSAAAKKLPGARVFASAGCAGCHTLKAANASGQVGPNLDELKPDESTVARQVRNGGNGMPSFRSRLSGTQIDQVATFVYEATKGAGNVPYFKPDNTTIAGCEHSNKPFCYRQAFGNLAYKEGPHKALAVLAADDRTMPGVHADCHQISHWVGHAGLLYYKNDAGTALSHGAMTCNSGYYHGVLQLALAGLPKSKVVKKSQHLCDARAVNVDDFLLYQCVHGLGHGLMIYSGDDLPWSLSTCHKLLTSFDRVSCTGGVFMQNLDTTMGVSKYLSNKNPIYPCNIVKERDKVYCYLMVTSRILTLDGYNWKKTAGWCRKAESGWVATCFQSMGRDASGATQYIAKNTIQLCSYAGKNEDECLYGASRDYANNYAGGKEASVLCNDGPKRYRGYCYEGIGTILGAINRETEQRKSACDTVSPKRYLADCYRGAAIT